MGSFFMRKEIYLRIIKPVVRNTFRIFLRKLQSFTNTSTYFLHTIITEPASFWPSSQYWAHCRTSVPIEHFVYGQLGRIWPKAKDKML